MINAVAGAVIKFAETHAKFIIGVIVNVILIWGFCKLTDVFGRNIVNRLRMRNSDSPLLNLMPVLNRIIKVRQLPKLVFLLILRNHGLLLVLIHGQYQQELLVLERLYAVVEVVVVDRVWDQLL